jgi:hypothetical protein
MEALMKRKRPEHTFQIEVLDYLDAFGRRDLYWLAIPNGELRHASVGLRLKAEGVKRGVADICIMLEDGKSAWLELKAKKGRLSDEQIGFHAWCLRLGHLWACCRTMSEVLDVLNAWKVLRPDLEAAA